MSQNTTLLPAATFHFPEEELRQSLESKVEQWSQHMAQQTQQLQDTVKEAQTELHRLKTQYETLQKELSDLGAISPKEWKGDALLLPSWIETAEHLPDIPLEQLTPEIVEAFRTQVESETEGPTSEFGLQANVRGSVVRDRLQDLKKGVKKWRALKDQQQKWQQEQTRRTEQVASASSFAEKREAYKQLQDGALPLALKTLEIQQLQTELMHVVTRIRDEYVQGSLHPVRANLQQSKTFFQKLRSSARRFFGIASSEKWKPSERERIMEQLQAQIQPLEQRLTLYEEVEQRVLDKSAARAQAARQQWDELHTAFLQDQEQFDQAWNAWLQHQETKLGGTQGAREPWPSPGSARFAQDLLRRLPMSEYETKVPTKREESRCNLSSDATVTLSGFQKVIGKLMQPALVDVYPGLVMDHMVGAGKTKSMYQIVLEWLQVSDAEILVLLPSTRVLANWIKELAGVPELQMHLKDVESLESGTSELIFDTGLRVILHCFLLSLPPALYKRWEPNPSNPALKQVSKLMLEDQSYEEDMYKPIPASKRKSLQKQLQDTSQKLLKNQAHYVNIRTVALPPKGVVMVDEVHLMINPTPIVVYAHQSNCVLAWAMLLKYESRLSISKLFATGTPNADSHRLMDVIRLLNLTKRYGDPKAHFLPEGVWRRMLSKKAQEQERVDKASESLAHTAQLAEEAFLSQWLSVPENKIELQRAALGCWSWVSLEHDRTVYPQISQECVAEGQCVLEWVRSSSSSAAKDSSSSFALQPLPTLPNPVSAWPGPTGSRKGYVEILVPMSDSTWDNYRKAVGEDMKRFAQTKRPGCSDTSAACLNYAQADLKTALGKGWGFRDTHKFEVLWKYFEQWNQEKHWVSTGARTFQDFGRKFVPFFQSKGYEVFGLPEALSLWKSAPKSRSSKNVTVKSAVQAWYEKNSPGNRLLFFGASVTLDQLDKILRQADENSLLTLLLELNNDARNLNGTYFRAFVGDAKSGTGITLLDTRFAWLLEPAPSPSAETQAIARIRRFCSLSRRPNIQDWVVHVFILVATVPLKASAVPPSSSKKKTSVKKKTNTETAQEEKGVVMLLTNEQYQAQRFDQEAETQTESSVAATLMQLIRFAAGDCLLTAAYNSHPGQIVQCFRDPTLGPDAKTFPLEVVVDKDRKLILAGKENQVLRLDFHGQIQELKDVPLERSTEPDPDVEWLDLGPFTFLDVWVHSHLLASSESSSLTVVEPVEQVLWVLQHTNIVSFDDTLLPRLASALSQVGKGGQRFLRQVLDWKRAEFQSQLDNQYSPELVQEVFRHMEAVANAMDTMANQWNQLQKAAHHVLLEHTVSSSHPDK